MDSTDTIEEVYGQVTLSPRFLFSQKIMIAEALQCLDGMMAGIERLERLPENERESAAGNWHDAALETKNPFIILTAPSMKYAVKVHGQDRLESRLARVAAALAWYELEKGSYPPNLADLVPKYLPEAPEDFLNRRPLSYCATQDTATVYAFGVDGDDDGGTPVPEDAVDDNGDSVWTVKRQASEKK